MTGTHAHERHVSERSPACIAQAGHPPAPSPAFDRAALRWPPLSALDSAGSKPPGSSGPSARNGECLRAEPPHPDFFAFTHALADPPGFIEADVRHRRIQIQVRWILRFLRAHSCFSVAETCAAHQTHMRNNPPNHGRLPCRGSRCTRFRADFALVRSPPSLDVRASGEDRFVTVYVRGATPVASSGMPWPSRDGPRPADAEVDAAPGSVGGLAAVAVSEPAVSGPRIARPICENLRMHLYRKSASRSPRPIHSACSLSAGNMSHPPQQNTRMYPNLLPSVPSVK